MGRQVKGICQRVIPQDRPNAVTEKMTNFIVVSLPYSETYGLMGESDEARNWWLNITVVYEIFVADRKNADGPKELDDKTMERFRKQVFDTFPLCDTEKGFKIVSPRTVISASSDGNGYHYTRIQAKVTTLV